MKKYGNVLATVNGPFASFFFFCYHCIHFTLLLFGDIMWAYFQNISYWNVGLSSHVNIKTTSFWKIASSKEVFIADLRVDHPPPGTVSRISPLASKNSEVALSLPDQQLRAHISFFREPWKRATTQVRFLSKGPFILCKRADCLETPSNTHACTHKHVLYALLSTHTSPRSNCHRGPPTTKTMWQYVIYCVRKESRRG